MTASLSNNVNPPFATGVDPYVNPPFIGYALRAPTVNDIMNPGTQWMDNSVNPAVIYVTTGAGRWNTYTGLSSTFSSLTVAGPANINTTGSGVSSIGTGGTGATNIGNTSGNTTVTGNLTTTGSVTVGTFASVTGSILAGQSITAQTGSLFAGTTVTAASGAITATNGNFVKGTAGNKDIYSSVASTTAAGANSAGTVTLVAGTATIATTAVTANSIIRIYRQGIGSTGAAALGILTIGTKTAGTSFVINSVTPASATANQTTDVSVVAWEIVN